MDLNLKRVEFDDKTSDGSRQMRDGPSLHPGVGGGTARDPVTFKEII
jgi:hypothetical protein